MKRIISILLAIVLCLSFSSVAFAGTIDADETEASINESVESDTSTRAEETIWYFRIVNGIKQMRLWSITYRKWLTDWIDIGPYVGG